MLDKHSREYTKYSDLKAGDEVELDSGFTCMVAGKTFVRQDEAFQLYLPCTEGRHYLLCSVADNDEFLIGIYKVEKNAR